MISIIDYGVGNISSLLSSFKYIGEDAVLTDDKNVIKNSDKIILPGVGAFGDAIKKLRDSSLDELLISQAKSSKPIMGICLGMQMLFEKSYEFGCFEGLSLIPGDVMPIKPYIPENLKIPHIGWNGLKFPNEKNKIFKYTNENDCVYFVHSYYAANCEKNTIATCEYGASLTAAVAKDNVYGMQFHPEKSAAVGLSILKAFCEL